MLFNSFIDNNIFLQARLLDQIQSQVMTAVKLVIAAKNYEKKESLIKQKQSMKKLLKYYWKLTKKNLTIQTL